MCVLCLCVGRVGGVAANLARDASSRNHELAASRPILGLSLITLPVEERFPHRLERRGTAAPARRRPLAPPTSRFPRTSIRHAARRNHGYPAAGGTDLLVGVRLGTRNPERVVDLKKIPELTAINIDAEAVHIGAAASAFSILHDSDVPSFFPGFAEALDLIGSTQIQGRCSAGGNLCNASPAADSIPALIANGAQCLITGPGGDHQMPVEDFVVAPSKNALKEGELLVALILPRPSPQTAAAKTSSTTPAAIHNASQCPCSATRERR